MGFLYFDKTIINDCICIKIPDGNLENLTKSKIILYESYRYELDENISRIYNKDNMVCLFIREKDWFYEHFATKETFRDIQINEILKG